MSTVLRELFFLGLAAGLTWWFLLRTEADEPRPEPTVASAAPLSVRTSIDRPQPVQAQAAPTEADLATSAAPPAPSPPAPPPERGAPDGDAEGEAVSEPSALAATDLAPVESLRSDPELVEEARRDIEGEVRRGFQTVLLAAPEDQLDLARAFGEELVLVPRRALDPRNPEPVSYRLRTDGAPRVETVRGRPDLDAYRQYRDLFDYEYGRLPQPLRELRRTVLSREEVFLFAALIPVSEWAVVVGRRREALERLDRTPDEVQRFVLRYVRLAPSAFDLRVEEITFADGTRERIGSTTP